jgi:hypothetical protein
MLNLPAWVVDELDVEEARVEELHTVRERLELRGPSVSHDGRQRDTACGLAALPTSLCDPHSDSPSGGGARHIIGGGVMVGAVYWFVYLRRRPESA